MKTKTILDHYVIFSPIVELTTIQVILTLVLSRGVLHVQT